MRLSWMALLVLPLAGCVTSPVYNNVPAPAAAPAEIAFNEAGLKDIQDGMSLAQVHQLMGPEVVIGYAYQASAYKPLTVPNPYRTKTIGADYTIEYYLQAIRQPDGVVKDDELMPLVFKDGKLIGRGWPLANSLPGGHTS